MIWAKTTFRFENDDEGIAEKELEFVRYHFLHSASEVNISNYFSLPEGTNKIASSVEVDYQVFIPDNVTLIIGNEYGSCTIGNLQCYLTINQKYGAISLDNFAGIGRIFGDLCDVRLDGIVGNLDLITSNSDIFLNNLKGKANLETKNGTLSIVLDSQIDNLKSTYSKVDLSIPDIYQYNYSISARKANIELGDRFRNFPFQVSKLDKLLYKADDTVGNIDISLSYNSIKLH